VLNNKSILEYAPARDVNSLRHISCWS